jgi:DNA-directed RNA polymerase subunit RPC12/RpoP
MLNFGVKSCTHGKQVYICTRQRYTIKNKNNMSGITSYKCLHCDWREYYYNEVMDAAKVLSDAYNVKENEETCWEDFIDDAIEELSTNKNVHIECDYCHDHND